MTDSFPRPQPRTVGVRKTGGTPATTYGFDALDRLTTETTGPTTTTYAWDGLDRLAQVNGQSSTFAGLERDPVAASGQLYQRNPAGGAVGFDPAGAPGPALLRSNHRGDITSTFTPGAGATTTSRGFSPHGTTTQTGTAQPALGYQGDWTSTSGLVHMDARWYDPTSATFLTRDSANLTGTAAGSNRYTYGNANPTTHTDPTGHNPCLISGGPGAVYLCGDYFTGYSVAGSLGELAGAAPQNHLGGAGDGCKHCGTGVRPSTGSGYRPAHRPAKPFWVRPSYDRPRPTHAPPAGHIIPPAYGGSRPTAEPSDTLLTAPAAGIATAYLPRSYGIPQVQLVYMDPHGGGGGGGFSPPSTGSNEVPEPEQNRCADNDDDNIFEAFGRSLGCTVYDMAAGVPRLPGSPGTEIFRGVQRWVDPAYEPDYACEALTTIGCTAYRDPGAVPGMLFRGARDFAYDALRCNYAGPVQLGGRSWDTAIDTARACGRAIPGIAGAAATEGAGTWLRTLGRGNGPPGVARITRRPQDVRVNPRAPLARSPFGRPVGRASHNQRIAAILEDIKGFADDIRVNQQQVNAAGERVGINRPDLQYTVRGRRYYVEIEGLDNPRGADHRDRILANDPEGHVDIKLVK